MLNKQSAAKIEEARQALMGMNKKAVVPVTEEQKKIDQWSAKWMENKRQELKTLGLDVKAVDLNAFNLKVG